MTSRSYCSGIGDSAPWARLSSFSIARVLSTRPSVFFHFGVRLSFVCDQLKSWSIWCRRFLQASSASSYVGPSGTCWPYFWACGNLCKACPMSSRSSGSTADNCCEGFPSVCACSRFAWAWSPAAWSGPSWSTCRFQPCLNYPSGWTASCRWTGLWTLTPTQSWSWMCSGYAGSERLLFCWGSGHRDDWRASRRILRPVQVGFLIWIPFYLFLSAPTTGSVRYLRWSSRLYLLRSTRAPTNQVWLCRVFRRMNFEKWWGFRHQFEWLLLKHC